MERTINGIDYIVKSEVLGIIDEEMRSARGMREYYNKNEIPFYTWTGYIDAMNALQARLANIKER